MCLHYGKFQLLQDKIIEIISSKNINNLRNFRDNLSLQNKLIFNTILLKYILTTVKHERKIWKLLLLMKEVSHTYCNVLFKTLGSIAITNNLFILLPSLLYNLLVLY